VAAAAVLRLERQKQRNGSRRCSGRGCVANPRSILCVVSFLAQLEQRVHKLAKKTHKDRVADFNKHLETLSEHHDIPKVSKYPTALLQPNLTASFRLVPDKIQPGCCLSSLSRFSWSFCMLSTCTATKQAPSTIYHWVRRELRSGHSSVQLLQRNTWLERVNYVPE
jgi:hypothetical protein